MTLGGGVNLYGIPAINGGLNHLLKNDPVFSCRNFVQDDFSWPHMGPGFATLTRIVLGQQVSTKAADSLWQKFSGALGRVDPTQVLSLSDEAFQSLGVSRQKTSYIRGLSKAVQSESLNIEYLNEQPDEVVYETLTALKGFGRWSAEMYLMFGLARPDVWAPADLGIREGMRLYLNLPERPSAERTQEEGARFAPYRTAASLLLWKMKDSA